MPNWCENILKSSISLEKYVNEIGDFDFNLIKPMPKSFKGLPSPGPSDEDIEKLREKGDIINYNKYHPYIMNMKQTGSRDWYDWSVKNWGCKWNAINGWISDDFTELTFATPWGPPVEIINELARLHPDAKFNLEFAEPGMGFSGYIKYDGTGEMPEIMEFSIDDEAEGRQIALDVLGEGFFEDDE